MKLHFFPSQMVPRDSFLGLSALLFIISLPSSLLFYLPDSNPLLSFGSHGRDIHLYTGTPGLLSHPALTWVHCHDGFFLFGADNQRRGMYLQMSTDGRVSGSDVQTANSEYFRTGVNMLGPNGAQKWKKLVCHCVLPGVLELKSVRNGHVVIRGKSSSLFLCMDSRGHLWGQVHDKHNYTMHAH